MKALLFAITLFLTIPTFARIVVNQGHAVGNGGGVVCIAGKCLTLQEAGLQLSPEFNGVWIPESIHFSTVKENVQKYIFAPAAVKEAFNYGTFKRVDEFRKVQVMDPAKLAEIKLRYLDIAQKAGIPIDPATFEVVAISSDDTVSPALTYLLPKFFELSQAQQSTILFHEGLYRGRPSQDLKYILQFESAMFNLSTKGPVFKSQIDELILAHKLGFMNKAELFGTLISSVINSKGFLSRDIVEPWLENIEFTNGKWTLQLDPGKILDLAPIEPRLPYMFSRISSIPLKASLGGNNSWNCNGFLTVDWGSSGVPRFYPCIANEEHQGYIFEIADPGALDLILPE